MNCVKVVTFFFLLPFCIGFEINDYDDYSDDCYESYKTRCCKGFELINGNCVPNCKGGCPESLDCIAPNVCGYLAPLMRGQCSNKSTIDFCLECNPAYIPNGYECQPYCENDCTNGVCDSPGICLCNEDYFFNYKTSSCELIDYLPDKENFPTSTTEQISTIDEDFIDSTKSVTTNCHNECRDGICIDGLCQNQTSSNKKHTQISTTPSVTTNCQNKCRDGICINGLCQKQTSSTQELISTSTTESPIRNCQDNCHNGVCNQNGICKCNPGYISYFGRWCISICNRECRNGNCVSINECRCHEGFSPHPDDSFMCVADFVGKNKLFFRNFLQLMWMRIVVVITVVIIILFGCLFYNKFSSEGYV